MLNAVLDTYSGVVVLVIRSLVSSAFNFSAYSIALDFFLNILPTSSWTITYDIYEALTSLSFMDAWSRILLIFFSLFIHANPEIMERFSLLPDRHVCICLFYHWSFHCSIPFLWKHMSLCIKYIFHDHSPVFGVEIFSKIPSNFLGSLH